jgi:glycyl-tRNA synthetase alpha chain
MAPKAWADEVIAKLDADAAKNAEKAAKNESKKAD